MSGIRANRYLGVRPGVHPHRLADSEAQVALNARLLSGALEPFYARAATRDLDSTTAPRTIFQDQNGLWLEFGEFTRVINNLIGNDPFDRVYFCGSGGPRVTDNARRTTGSGPYPGASLKLGVPTPDDPPVAAITNEGLATDPDNGVPNLRQSRTYVVTVVNSYGEEGVQSFASDTVSVFPEAQVTLTMPALLGVSEYELARWNVYRITEGVAQFVGSTPSIATTTFVDDVAGDLAGEALDSSDYLAPPDDLRGLIAVNGRFLAGFRNNEVLLSSDGLPHAFPLGLRQQLDYNVVSIASFGGIMAVMTEGPLYLAQGSSPETMILLETATQEACLSEESVVAFAGGIAYASPHGLVFVDSSGPALTTGLVMTEREWRDLNPASFRATHWNGLYFCSYQNAGGPGAFIFDPRTPQAGIIFLSLPRLSAIYNDPELDRLYMVDAGASGIVEWDGDANATYAPFRWRSRPYELPAPAPMNVAQVMADAYPVTLRAFADGALQAEITIANERPHRLPGARRARDYSVEVEGTTRVYDVIMARTVEELRGV